MTPVGYQRIDQHIFSILVLIVKPVYFDVSKKRRLAFGGITGTFTNEAPVVDQSIIVVDIPSVVAKTCSSVGLRTNAAVGVAVVAVFLCGIFVVVTVVVVPHVAHKITAVVVECDVHRIIVDLGLYYSFAVVLVQCFCLNSVLGQVHCFDHQAEIADIRQTHGSRKIRNFFDVDTETHMEQELEPGLEFISIAAEHLACVSVITQGVTTKETF